MKLSVAHQVSVIRGAALLGAMSLFACGVADEPKSNIVSSRQGIVNGRIDERFPAIGILKSGNGVGCTATLIGSQTVLTAGHCVDNASSVSFLVGGLKDRTILAKSVTIHPHYDGGNNADLAVVHLESAVTDVAPLSLSQHAPYVGQSITIFGFGASHESGEMPKNNEILPKFGVKQSALNTVERVYDELFSFVGTGGNVCDGDSGGPTLATVNGETVVIGVHSTKAGICGEMGLDTRIDMFRPWINQVANEAALLDKPITNASNNGVSVEFINPIAESRQSSSFSVSIAASSGTRAIDQVDLYIDDKWMLSLYEAPFTFNIERLGDGVHTLKAVATDETGATNSSTMKIIVGNGNYSFDDCVGSTCGSHNVTESGSTEGDHWEQGCQLGSSRHDLSLPSVLALGLIVSLLRRRRIHP